MVVMKEEKLCVCQGPLSCLPVVTVSCGHVALAAARSVRTDRAHAAAPRQWDQLDCRLFLPSCRARGAHSVTREPSVSEIEPNHVSRGFDAVTRFSFAARLDGRRAERS